MGCCNWSMWSLYRGQSPDVVGVDSGTEYLGRGVSVPSMTVLTPFPDVEEVDGIYGEVVVYFRRWRRNHESCVSRETYVLDKIKRLYILPPITTGKNVYFLDSESLKLNESRYLDDSFRDIEVPDRHYEEDMDSPFYLRTSLHLSTDKTEYFYPVFVEFSPPFPGEEPRRTV